MKIGLLILAYYVIGFIVMFGTVIKFFEGLTEIYSMDVIDEAMSHLNEMTAQTINDDPAGSFKNIILNWTLWPKLGNNMQDMKQYIESECEFVSNLKQ